MHWKTPETRETRWKCHPQYVYTTDDILQREPEREVKISRKGHILNGAPYTVTNTRTTERPRKYLSKPPCQARTLVR